VAEIRIMSFNFPPKGWATCDGQLLPINQNQALFSLLGTTFGGNGQTTFGLPDMRSRTPIHQGNGHVMGERAGVESVTLSQTQMASHIHSGTAAPVATSASPANNIWAKTGPAAFTTTPGVAMNPATVSSVGGSQPHTNLAPFLVLEFCVALQGIFPSPN
jgi:microcystin-dependent protein